MGDLEGAEQRVMRFLSRFLKDIEVTAMTKSFKMVLLEALVEIDGLRSPPTLDALAVRSREVLERRHDLLRDLSTENRELQASSIEWRRYWRKNPVDAWIGRNCTDSAGAYFRIENDRFRIVVDIPTGDDDSSLRRPPHYCWGR